MLSEKEMKQLEKEGYDFEFIESIRPQGGVSFKENKIMSGDGYYSCLHIYQLPKRPNPFWLTTLMGNLNTVTKVDISSVDKERVIRDINRSLREYSDRMKSERTKTDRNNAADEYAALEQFAREINQGGEVTKIVDIRIFVTGSSQEELEKAIGDLRKSLNGLDYRAVVYIGQQKDEWMAFFQNYTEQQATVNRPEGVQIGATVMGGGYPFNHQYLIDPRGTYLGQTETKGVFIHDPFHVTQHRKSFCGMLLGSSGYGKSTLMKMIEEGLFGRNCIIRGFEKNKDWYRLIRSQNGKILDLSGKDGMLNPLEPLATITDENGEKIDELNSYYQHRSKFFNQVKFLNPDMRDVDILDFSSILDAFYIEYGLLPVNYDRFQDEIRIIGRKPTDYPIMEDFHKFLEVYLERPQFQTVTETKKVALEDFRTVITSMTSTYGAIFNGHTTLTDIDSEQVLFFDINTIDGFSTPIKHCQLFTAISLVWQQAMYNGLQMKTKLANGEIGIDEVKFFMFFLDECQNVLNESCEFVADYIISFQKEMRKFSAGVYFATQSPEIVLPKNATERYAAKIGQIFELCNAKFFLHLDSSVMDTMKRAMRDTFTASEYDALSKLTEGEVIVSLGGSDTYKIKTDPQEEQLVRFAGGH